MTPEDVLIEAVIAASRRGDSPELRELACRKLKASIEQYCFSYLKYDHLPESDEAVH